MSARLHHLWPSVTAFLALIALYIAERLFAGFPGIRQALDGLAGGLVMLTLTARSIELARAPADRRPVLWVLLASSASIGLAIASYLLMVVFYGQDVPANERPQAVLSALWAVAAVLGLTTLAGVELSVWPAAFIPRYERRRVVRGQRRGLSFGLLLAFVFLVNFQLRSRGLKIDLASTGILVPSPSAKQVVEELTKPVKIVLFYPRSSDLLELLRGYFEALGKNPNLEITAVDHAVAYQTAFDHAITENGWVVVSRDGVTERIQTGTSIEAGRILLNRFDEKLAKSLVKVSRDQQVAYFTIGHGERSTNPGKDDLRPALKIVAELLESNQFVVRGLGITEGLAAEVPADAALVFIIGPTKPFLREEMGSLKRALTRGVRLFVALEPGRQGEPMTELMAALGLELLPAVLANEQAYVRVSNTVADRANVYTNLYSSHAAIGTLAQANDRPALLFPRTASFARLPRRPDGVKARLVVSALESTFNDENGNLQLDGGAEKQWSFELVEAATIETKEGETRAYVMASPDAITDDFIRFQGNLRMFNDAFAWLRDSGETVVSPLVDGDAPLVHRREQDVYWFYSTIFGVPALVAGAGYLQQRRRRKRR